MSSGQVWPLEALGSLVRVRETRGHCHLFRLRRAPPLLVGGGPEDPVPPRQEPGGPGRERMENQKLRAFKKGGTLEDWNDLLQGGLLPHHMTWVNGKDHDDVLAYAESVLGKGCVMWSMNVIIGMDEPRAKLVCQLRIGVTLVDDFWWETI